MVISLEPHVHRDHFKMTFKPKAADFLHRDGLAGPMDSHRRLRLAASPRAFGNLRDWFQQTSFRMYKKQIPTVMPFIHRHDATPKVANVQHTHFSIMHERLPLHELEHVRLDVSSDDAVRLDHG